jgi:hypothetical protein
VYLYTQYLEGNLMYMLVLAFSCLCLFGLHTLHLFVW